MSKIIKNYIYNSIYQILTIMIPIVTIPYAARVLGAEGIGINGYVASISTLFIYIGLLGLDKYASREIAYKRGNKDELNKTFSQLVILRVIMMVITSIFYIIFSLFSEYKIFLLIQLVYVIGYLLDISWLYNGMEEFKKPVTRSIIVKTINIVCLFLFIKQPSDLWKYIAINATLVLIGNLILYHNVKMYVKLEKVEVKDIIKHIPLTIKVFIPQIAIQTYLQLGKIMIEAITNSATDVAFYDQADKIVKLPLALITALSTIMLPRISNEFKKNNKEKVKEYINKSLSFSLFLGIPIMVGIIGISDTLVPWLLGEEFFEVIKVIKILAPVVIAICITNVIADQYLMAVNNTKALTESYIIGAIANFVINIILISRYSYIGAAISMVITEIIIVLIQLINAKQIINIKDVMKSIWKYVIAAISMLIPIALVKNININIMLITLLQVFFGMITYIMVLFILKDVFLEYIIKQVKNKVKRL